MLFTFIIVVLSLAKSTIAENLRVSSSKNTEGVLLDASSNTSNPHESNEENRRDPFGRTRDEYFSTKTIAPVGSAERSHAINPSGRIEHEALKSLVGTKKVVLLDTSSNTSNPYDSNEENRRDPFGRTQEEYFSTKTIAPVDSVEGSHATKSNMKNEMMLQATANYNCYLPGTLINTLSIWWGFTDGDGGWACNAWLPACRGQCTARRNGLFKCLKNGQFAGWVGIWWGFTNGDAGWACNQWIGNCQGVCSAAEVIPFPDWISNDGPGAVFRIPSERTCYGNCGDNWLPVDGCTSMNGAQFMDELNPACNAHDICYRCSGTPGWGLSKVTCDNILHSVGYDICNSLEWFKVLPCRSTVDLMRIGLGIKNNPDDNSDCLYGPHRFPQAYTNHAIRAGYPSNVCNDHRC